MTYSNNVNVFIIDINTLILLCISNIILTYICVLVLTFMFGCFINLLMTQSLVPEFMIRFITLLLIHN